MQIQKTYISHALVHGRDRLREIAADWNASKPSSEKVNLDSIGNVLVPYSMQNEWVSHLDFHMKIYDSLREL